MIKIKIFLSILLMIVIITGVWFFWQTKQMQTAPDVVFTTITGKKIALKKLQGKAVIITFWATDCKSCIEEVPHLIELYNDYHAQGLEIIAVAMYYDPPNHVVDITKAKQIPYDVALDLRAEHAKAFGNIQLTPTTLLINPQGKISFQKTGLFDSVAMKQRLEILLNFNQE